MFTEKTQCSENIISKSGKRNKNPELENPGLTNSNAYIKSDKSRISSYCIHYAADFLHMALREFKHGAIIFNNRDAELAMECMDDFASHLHARPILHENKKEAGALFKGFFKHYRRRIIRKPTLDLCSDIYVELDATRAQKIPDHRDKECSFFAYPEIYKGPREITEQIYKIAGIFDLDPRFALEFVNNINQSRQGDAQSILPSGAEGWFAVPSLRGLNKKYFPHVSDPDEIYCKSLKLAHVKLKESRNFYAYLPGGISKERLRILPSTLRGLGQIENSQKGDILVIPAQLGLKHRGESPSLAKDTYSPNEYGLDSFSLCAILLTHPERLAGWNELGIECPGNVFDYYKSGLFTHTPTYSLRGTGVRAYHLWNWDGYANYGSATFYAPERQKLDDILDDTSRIQS